MTGYAQLIRELSEDKISLDIRSYNSRFLNLKVTLPKELEHLQGFIEGILSKLLNRGKIEVTIRFLPSTPFTYINLKYAKRCYQEINKLKKELKIEDINPLLNIPDIFLSPQMPDTPEIKNSLKEILCDGIKMLREMQEQEGKQITKEFKQRLKKIKKILKSIEKLKEEISLNLKQAMLKRISLLSQETSISINPSRLEQEIAILLQKTDITEELSRIKTHIKKFESLLPQDSPLGKKLDFLLQEMAREANTLTVKAQEAKISHYIIDLKEEIERIKEQVQNIE